MTARERAYEVARKWMPDSAADSMKVIALTALIQIAIEDTIAAEREACAAVAEAGCRCEDARDHIADRIRARGTTGGGK